jgi:hypothetical protein
MKKILLFVTSLLFIASPVFAAPVKIPPLKICLSSDGTLLAKKRCKASEQAASFFDFQTSADQGPQGPQGPAGAPGIQGPQGPAGANGVADISACRSIFNSQSTTEGTAVVPLYCNPSTEYLLNYGNHTDPEFSLQFLRSTQLYYSDAIPYGVRVIAQTELNSSGAYEVFTFYVTATCCPK